MLSAVFVDSEVIAVAAVQPLGIVLKVVLSIELLVGWLHCSVAGGAEIQPVVLTGLAVAVAEVELAQVRVPLAN